MAVNENDLELLQEYLDGEMPMSECEGLWRRLAVEREMASELERLRADAAVREVVWSSAEPDDASVAELQRNILVAMRRSDRQEKWGRFQRAFFTVAACIMMGFGLGWMGHERLPSMSFLGKTNIADIAGPMSPFMYKVDLMDASGKVIASPKFDTYEEARKFADDYAKARAARQNSHQTPAPSGDQF